MTIKTIIEGFMRDIAPPSPSSIPDPLLQLQNTVDTYHIDSSFPCYRFTNDLSGVRRRKFKTHQESTRAALLFFVYDPELAPLIPSCFGFAR
ncbi:hypothetical protein JG687_00013608 [Phytophthora cactorum]|uniref:Uncharacterized protein n=1 Tax=Phytophthora cactorum TaxID=29920 RepID=A0A8T1U227_9STRA|nr:hypothetical protein JG687_00013608 [Phytophthora cactorum]